ncbi:hypothetical protein ABEW34_26095 [Paenibacillus algorifonticola]|uniref:hypothetical protein n=1 Tax=Paenibacillus algorifonticola TaxID=684063 RepID=UPI003D27B032
MINLFFVMFAFSILNFMIVLILSLFDPSQHNKNSSKEKLENNTRNVKIEIASRELREQIERHIKMVSEGGLRKPIIAPGIGGGKYKISIKIRMVLYFLIEKFQLATVV